MSHPTSPSSGAGLETGSAAPPTVSPPQPPVAARRVKRKAKNTTALSDPPSAPAEGKPGGSGTTAAASQSAAAGGVRPPRAPTAAAAYPPESSATLAADDKVSKCSEVAVEHIREQVHLPAAITTRAMSVEERSTRPPPSMVAFNKAIMKHGARLPLHYLVRGVLANWGLAPSQLNPNAYKIMAGMHILWRPRFGVDPSVEEVYHLYKKSEAGYFFLPRGRRRRS